jgi:hypothetical protein
MHKRAFPWLKQARAKEFDMIVVAHTIAELYAVLSTLPIKPLVSPLIARKLISENIETWVWIDICIPINYYCA